MLKVKNEIGGRDGIRDTVSETGYYSARERKEGLRSRTAGRAREIDCPRFCPPRFIVRLHQSSAKRADRTEETGELWRRRV